MILLIASFAVFFNTSFGGSTNIHLQTQLLPKNASKCTFAYTYTIISVSSNWENIGQSTSGSNIAHLSANTTPNFISVIKGGGPTINSDRMRTKSIMNITRMKADGPPPRVHPLQQALAKGSAMDTSMQQLPSKLGRTRAVSSGLLEIRKAAGTFKVGITHKLVDSLFLCITLVFADKCHQRQCQHFSI
jgi:hypothetical protein